MTRIATATRTRTWLTFPSLLSGVFVALLLPFTATGFTSVSIQRGLRMSYEPRQWSALHHSPERGLPESRLHFLSGLAGGAATLIFPAAALADPPLEKFTKDGICLKRNLNGSCSEFGIGKAAEEAASVSKKAPAQEEPESDLMVTLKKRTADNKAKNDEEIAAKTFVNGQSGEFGPFSRYVPVKHKDTGRFELVLVRELDKMKRSGLVVSERGEDCFADGK